MLPPPWLAVAAAATTPSKITIEMVSDVVCPYCYIGLHRLQKALAATSSHADQVEIKFTPFILRRHLPKEGVAKHEVFRRQFGDASRGARMLAQVEATAAADGLTFNLTNQRAGNSEDAHRLLLWSGTHVMNLSHSMMRAYNEEQGWLGDHAVLLSTVQRTTGLDADEAARVLADPTAHAEELEAGLRRAHELGVTGVPAYFVNGQLLGSGALSEGALRSVIEHSCAAT